MTRRERSSMRAFAILLTLLFAGSASAADPDGAEVYKAKCRFCHGKEGTPSAAMAKQGVRDFRDPEWAKANTEEKVREAIEVGTKGTLMRSFEKELSPEEIEAVAKFVLSLGKPE
jgi:mono/diheme cytochrome c family protein